MVPGGATRADVRSVRFAHAFKEKTGDDWNFEQFRHMLPMLAAATNQTQSVDPLAVAKALEGIRIAGDTGELWMHAEDHQPFNSMFIATLARSGARPARARHFVALSFLRVPSRPSR